MKKLYMKRAISFQFAKLGIGVLLAIIADRPYAQHSGGKRPPMQEDGRISSKVPVKEKVEGRKIDPKNFDLMPYYSLFKRDES